LLLFYFLVFVDEEIKWLPNDVNSLSFRRSLSLIVIILCQKVAMFLYPMHLYDYLTSDFNNPPPINA